MPGAAPAAYGPVFPIDPTLQKETDMNPNQIKGTLKNAAGKLRRKAGEATGSTEQQVKGAVDQVKGKTQKAVGDVQEAVRRGSRTPH